MKVQISKWAYYEEKLRLLMTHLRKEKHIYSIDIDKNIVTVTFNPSVIGSDTEVKRLLSFIDEFDL